LSFVFALCVDAALFGLTWNVFGVLSRSQDIKVVMAMGDSMTAGFAIMGRSTIALLDEWRGLSGFVGGDPGAITLPNFFQHYSPNVIGASVGAHFLEWAGWVPSTHRSQPP
jgi:hypothetical protein